MKKPKRATMALNQNQLQNHKQKILKTWKEWLLLALAKSFEEVDLNYRMKREREDLRTLITQWILPQNHLLMILLNLLSNLFKELVAHHEKSAKTLLKHLKSKNKMFRSIKILVQPFLILQVKLLSSEIYLLKFKKRNNIPSRLIYLIKSIKLLLSKIHRKRIL